MPTKFKDLPANQQELAHVLAALEFYAIAIIKEAAMPYRKDGKRSTLTVAGRFGFMAALAEAIEQPAVAELLKDIGIRIDPRDPNDPWGPGSRRGRE